MCRLEQRVQSYEEIAEECGWQVGKEKFLWGKKATTPLELTERGVLGRGRTGEVHEVTVRGKANRMVRKRIIIRKHPMYEAKCARERIRTEINNLKCLDHHHIVKVLGCYEEPIGESSYVYVLMYPAGNEDLNVFLTHICEDPRLTSEERRTYSHWIHKWFTCLASALAYMHSQNIHHEDIKPGNIVHRHGHIFFTDFGSSRKFEIGAETSTANPAAASNMFAAPEALDYNERHGSKTDVFSLGLVFVEMLTVFCGYKVTKLRDFVFGDKSKPEMYHLFVDQGDHSLEKWFMGGWRKRKSDATMSVEGALSTNIPMWSDCIRAHMLHTQRSSRSTPQEVFELLHRERYLGTIPPCEYADPQIIKKDERMDQDAAYTLTIKPVALDGGSSAGYTYSVQHFPNQVPWNNLKQYSTMQYDDEIEVAAVYEGHIVNVHLESGPAPAMIVEIRQNPTTREVYVVIDWLYAREDLNNLSRGLQAKMKHQFTLSNHFQIFSWDYIMGGAGEAYKYVTDEKMEELRILRTNSGPFEFYTANTDQTDCKIMASLLTSKRRCG